MSAGGGRARLRRPAPPAFALLAGGAALALTLAATLGAATAAWLRGGAGWPRLAGPDWRAVEFTLLQASLSAALSIAGGAALALALSRRRFPGRETAVLLLGAPFLLPVISAAFGIAAVWGRSGWISDGLAALGLPRLDVYGLPGILLAHVFFNLPLAARIFLDGLRAVPAERRRLAESLGLGPWAGLAHVEGPVLRRLAPGAFAVIFLICAGSFAAVLALGGGPRSATLELAIYEAVRLDFDLPRAAGLALVQTALCLSAGAAALALAAPSAAGPGLPPAPARAPGGVWRALDLGALLGVALFLAAPLAAVVARGAAALAELPSSVWAAAGRSLALGLGAAALAVPLAAGLAALVIALERTGRRAAASLTEGAALLALAASPLVMGLGLWVTLDAAGLDPFALALPAVGAINAVMALPFALRLTLPALREAVAAHGDLADQLGLRGLAWARHVLAAPLARPAGFAAGLSAALAAGDLGAIALFAPADAPTLPLMIGRLMGAYRMDQAAAAALLLLALSLVLFRVVERSVRAALAP